MATSKDLIFTILGIDKASHVFDQVGDSVEKSASRASKAMLGTVGAAAASSVAVAGALVGMPILFAAAGAAVMASNSEVANSYAALGHTLRTEVTQDAEPMAAALVGAATDIGTSYSKLRPLVRQAFTDAAPQVRELVGGVTDLAEHALPGMVTALGRSGPAVSGLRSMLKDTGIGVGEFFEIVSTGSDDAGQGMEHFGTLVRGTLPGAGQLMVELTGLWAEHGDQAARIVGKLVDVVADLGGRAMPLVSSGVGVALDVLEGILVVVEPISGMLGPMIGLWMAFGTAMRGITFVKGLVDGIGSSVGSVREKLSAAGGPDGVGKFATGVGGLMNVLGGPWGIAIAGAGLALAHFGQESQEAAADQRSLASALLQSAGAFDANARKTIINSEGYKEISGLVKRAGLSHRELVDALINGGPEYDNLKRRLDEQVDAGTRWQTANGHTSKSLTDKASASGVLKNSLDDLRGTVTGSIEDYQRERDALGEASSAMTTSLPGANSLREAIQTLGSDTAETADKVSALETAWRRLFGTSLSLEEATAAWEASLDQVASTIADAKKETTDWHAELFTAAGAVNLTTERGRALQDNLIEQGRSYRELAQTAYDTALQQGQSQEEAKQAVVDATAARRAALVDEWATMLGNRDMAIELANKYLGIPGQVQTLITDPGSAEAISRAIQLRDRILAVPDHKLVMTQAETGMSMQSLTDLGFKVEHLPDGKITVTAPNVAAVDEAINNAARDRQATITFGYGPGVGAGSGGNIRYAQGGFYPLEAYATGGVRKLTPMRGNSAQIVAPRTYRVIGDNPIYRESYIPINDSDRSQSLLAQTAAEMGWGLVPLDALGASPSTTPSAGGRGSTEAAAAIHRHYHLTIRNAGNREVDLVAAFRQLELMEG